MADIKPDEVPPPRPEASPSPKETIRPTVETPREPLIPEAGTPTSESLQISDHFRSQELVGGVREEIVSERDPYENSTALTKLRDRHTQGLPLKIAFLDIDSTLTFPKAPAPHEATRVRELLDEKGYVTFFVSSRTEEMMMDQENYRKSVEMGLVRRAPHLRKDSEGMHEAHPDELPEFAGIYNPDGIASTTGTRILLAQESGGYAVDKEYEARMKTDAEAFRKKTFEVLDIIDPEHGLFRNPDVDDPTAYHEGRADVDMPDFRVQLNFAPESVAVIHQSTGATDVGGPATAAEKLSAIQKKDEVKRRIRELMGRDDVSPEIKRHVRNMRMIDDSNPDAGRYSLYLTPIKGTKGRAVDRTIDRLTEELGVKPEDLHLFVAGDSFPDLEMGLLAGKGAEVQFLVAGKSRLTGALSHQITEDDIKDVAHGEFAGESLPIWRRFIPKDDGIMEFKRPLKIPKLTDANGNIVMDEKGEPIPDPEWKPKKRTVYVADKIYPDASNPIETVRRFIEETAV